MDKTKEDLIESLRSLIRSFASYKVKSYVKYILISVYTILGIPTFLFVIGYIILYGLYFGGSDSSLLDFSISYVPIHPIACIFIGTFFVALTLFVYSVIKLIVKEESKKRTKEWIFLSVFPFFVFHYILSVVLVSQSEEDVHINVIKLLMLWVLPITLALFAVFINFIANHYGNFFFSLIFSIIVFLYINNYVYSFKSYILISLIIGLSILLMVFIRFVTKLSNPKLLLIAISLLAGYVSVEFLISTMPQHKINSLSVLVGVPLITCLLFFLSKGLLSTFAKGKEDLAIEEEEHTNKMLGLINYLVLLISVIFLFFLPIFGSLLFTLGDYIGSTLKNSHLVSYEEILVGNDEPIVGKVVAADSSYIYISEKDRTLKVIKLPNDVGAQWGAIKK